MAISFDRIPANAVATARYIESENVPNNVANLVSPREIYVLGQYNSGKAPTNNQRERIFTEESAWDKYGRGSLLARMLKHALNLSNGEIPVYAIPMADDGSGVAATGSIAVTGTATAAGTVYLYIGGQRVLVSVASGDDADAVGTAIEAAITAAADLPVSGANTTGTVAVTAKFKGEPGNNIPLSLNYNEGEALPAGISIALTQMSSGANNPDIETALANIPEGFGQDIICPYSDATSMGYLQAHGESRYAPEVARQTISFVPVSESKADYITYLDDYNTQWITTVSDFTKLESPIFEMIAAIGGDFSRRNYSRPGVPIYSNVLTGIVPKANATNLSVSDKNEIVEAGGSTILITSDGQVQVGDLVTTRTETDLGAPDPDWRFTSTIANIQTKEYSLWVLVNSDPFIQATVVDNDAKVDVDYAVRPNTVKAFLIDLIDSLWISRALSKNRDEIVASINAEIDPTNGSRINVEFTDQIAAGLRVIAVKHRWQI